MLIQKKLLDFLQQFTTDSSKNNIPWNSITVLKGKRKMDGVRKGLIWGRGQLCRRLANDHWLCTNTGYWLELLTAFDTNFQADGASGP